MAEESSRKEKLVRGNPAAKRNPGFRTRPFRPRRLLRWMEYLAGAFSAIAVPGVTLAAQAGVIALNGMTLAITAGAVVGGAAVLGAAVWLISDSIAVGSVRKGLSPAGYRRLKILRKAAGRTDMEKPREFTREDSEMIVCNGEVKALGVGPILPLTDRQKKLGLSRNGTPGKMPESLTLPEGVRSVNLAKNGFVVFDGAHVDSLSVALPSTITPYGLEHAAAIPDSVSFRFGVDGRCWTAMRNVIGNGNTEYLGKGVYRYTDTRGTFRIGSDTPYSVREELAGLAGPLGSRESIIMLLNGQANMKGLQEPVDAVVNRFLGYPEDVQVAVLFNLREAVFDGRITPEEYAGLLNIPGRDVSDKVLGKLHAMEMTYPCKLDIGDIEAYAENAERHDTGVTNLAATFSEYTSAGPLLLERDDGSRGRDEDDGPGNGRTGYRKLFGRADGSLRPMDPPDLSALERELEEQFASIGGAGPDTGTIEIAETDGRGMEHLLATAETDRDGARYMFDDRARSLSAGDTVRIGTEAMKVLYENASKRHHDAAKTFARMYPVLFHDVLAPARKSVRRLDCISMLRKAAPSAVKRLFFGQSKEARGIMKAMSEEPGRTR